MTQRSTPPTLSIVRGSCRRPRPLAAAAAVPARPSHTHRPPPSPTPRVRHPAFSLARSHSPLPPPPCIAPTPPKKTHTRCAPGNCGISVDLPLPVNKLPSGQEAIAALFAEELGLVLEVRVTIIDDTGCVLGLGRSIVQDGAGHAHTCMPSTLSPLGHSVTHSSSVTRRHCRCHPPTPTWRPASSTRRACPAPSSARSRPTRRSTSAWAAHLRFRGRRRR